MATDWAGAVIRCERVTGRVPPSASGRSEAVLLLRVQLCLGDADPEVLGPVIVRRSDADRLTAAVLDRIFAAVAALPLEDEADRD